MAIGEARRFVSALIVLDPLAAADWAREHGPRAAPLAELAADPRLQEAVEAAGRGRQRGLLAGGEDQALHGPAGEWVPDSDELTPTAKLKRGAVAAKYADADRGDVRRTPNQGARMTALTPTTLLDGLVFPEGLRWHDDASGSPTCTRARC